MWMNRLSVGFIGVMVYNHTVRNKVEGWWRGIKKGRKYDSRGYGRLEEEDDNMEDDMRRVSREVVGEGDYGSSNNSRHDCNSSEKSNTVN